MRRRMLALALAGLLGVLAGCAGGPQLSGPARTVGSASVPPPVPSPLPPAAEPASAPPLRVAPAGRQVAVGAAPEGIVADPLTRIVAVGVRHPDQLVLLNADTGHIEGKVPLPGVLRHLQLAGSGGPVLVPDESSNSLLRVSLPTGKVVSQVTTGASPHDATRASNGTVFVADEAGASVVAVRSNQVVHTFTDVVQPAGLAHVGSIVGLVDVRRNSLTFYDATSLTPITALPAGTGPTHVIADKHGRMIVADTRGGELLVYLPPSGPHQIASQVARVELSGVPYGITYDPTRDRFWVTLTATNQLVGYDMSQPTPREIARIPTVRQPDTVTVDPGTGRLFVTGTTDGVVQIIDTQYG